MPALAGIAPPHQRTVCAVSCKAQNARGPPCSQTPTSAAWLSEGILSSHCPELGATPCQEEAGSPGRALPLHLWAGCRGHGMLGKETRSPPQASVPLATLKVHMPLKMQTSRLSGDTPGPLSGTGLIRRGPRIACGHSETRASHVLECFMLVQVVGPGP